MNQLSILMFYDAGNMDLKNTVRWKRRDVLGPE